MFAVTPFLCRVMPWKYCPGGAVDPAVRQHGGTDVLKVRVVIALQQKGHPDGALIRRIALVVTRGERESRSDSLQVGGGDDLFGWLDDLGHGLIVGERVRGIIPGIRRTRGMGFVHHQRTSC